MLGKLLKHEFKQSSRIILIILAILVVITPITALYTRFNMNRVPDTDLPFFDIFEALQGIATVLYVCAMIAAAAATVILLMYRFYKSMVTSEGYLTHTLPGKNILYSNVKAYCKYCMAAHIFCSNVFVYYCIYTHTWFMEIK